MKNLRNFITGLFAIVAFAAQAQVNPTTALIGSWSGKLNVGSMSLTIVLNLEQADGYVVVTLDSPDQGAKGIPTYKEYLSDDSVAVKMESLRATYRARLKDGKLEGTFAQNGMSFPLVMTRGVAELKRPQTPKQPFPYETEEVTFRNEADGATLAGTLTWPAGYDRNGGKKPVVVLLVSGSGQQNRDEELFDHKPFMVIADYLARQGVATLRYDDRGMGKSVGGEVKNATSQDFARDAEAGIEYLRSRKDFSSVGLLGHSEGGLIGFLLGAKGKTDFIIALAAPGVKGDTLLARQNNNIVELSGLPAGTVPRITVSHIHQNTKLNSIPWYKWFFDYDPSENIRKTRCPVLALNGERDCQVISSQNLTAISKLLPKSKKNMTRQYPELNHLFQHCKTGLPTEYGQIEETISQEVLQDIAQWIRNSIAL